MPAAGEAVVHDQSFSAARSGPSGAGPGARKRRATSMEAIASPRIGTPQGVKVKKPSPSGAYFLAP